MFFLKFLPAQAMIVNYREHFPEGAEGQIADKLSMLREASVLLRDLDDYFRASDFSLTRFLILVILDRNPAGLQHTQIVEWIDVSSPVVSRSLKSLIDEKLVILEADEGNPRLKKNRITEAGKERLHALMPGYYELLLK